MCFSQAEYSPGAEYTIHCNTNYNLSFLQNIIIYTILLKVYNIMSGLCYFLSSDYHGLMAITFIINIEFYLSILQAI